MQSLNNDKTNNAALDYHIHNNAGEGDFPNTNDGMFVVDAPHPILTHFENQMILAEAATRDGDAAAGLAARSANAASNPDKAPAAATTDADKLATEILAAATENKE